MSSSEVTTLLDAARAARTHALAPLTGVTVGVALQTADGRVFTGCNIESPSAIITICSERVALFKALSEGAREFVRIAVISDFHDPIPPCGFCRQALLEYAPGIEVIMATMAGPIETKTLAALVPCSYDIRDRADRS